MVQWALFRGALSAMLSIPRSNLKSFQNRPDLILDPAPPNPLGSYDGAKRGVGLGQVAIDQNIIVSVVVPDLLSRFPEPPFDLLRVRNVAAVAKPLFQNLPRGSQDKDGN